MTFRENSARFSGRAEEVSGNVDCFSLRSLLHCMVAPLKYHSLFTKNPKLHHVIYYYSPHTATMRCQVQAWALVTVKRRHGIPSPVTLNLYSFDAWYGFFCSYNFSFARISSAIR